jgi:predicted RNase H-like nuclease
MKTVIGVDGAPGGWIAVTWGTNVSHKLHRSFAEILHEDACIIAVDMPVGLPVQSGRKAEREARKGLGARQSSLFSIPCRAAVMEPDYRRACAINLEHSDPPRKIAKQSFHLFPKIREIDTLMSPALQTRVHEVHPEVAFWIMNGSTSVPLAKKHEHGSNLRRKLLADNGFPITDLPLADYLRKDVGIDDLIDACACAWVARRILQGKAMVFPDKPERDEKGLQMCIKA